MTRRTWPPRAVAIAAIVLLATTLGACGGGGGSSTGPAAAVDPTDPGNGGGDGGGGDDDGGTIEPVSLAVGELDPAFGKVDPAGSGPDERLGYVVPLPDPGTLESWGVAVAIDTQDRIVVAGVIDCLDLTSRATIWRFLSDGTPDPAFSGSGGPCVTGDPPVEPGGGTGYVTFPVDVFQSVHGLVLAGDGDIVIAGKMSGGALVGNAVWRFQGDGSLDTAFGEPASAGERTGYTLIDDADGAPLGLDSFGGRNAWFGLALDDAGRVLVAGSADNAGTGTDELRLLVARLTPDGALDTTFGDSVGGGRTGIFRFPALAAQPDDIGHDLLVDDAGRVVVVGRVQGAINRDGIALRLTSSGELDDTFGEPTGVPGVKTGYRILEYTASGSRDDSGQAVVLDSANRILVHGTASTSTGTAKVVWRLLPDGATDTDFENDRQPPTPGIIDTQVTVSVGGFPDCINQRDAKNGIALAAMDRAVVTGCWGLGDKYAAVERYTAAGDIDTAFGKGDFQVDAGDDSFPGYFRFTRVITDDAQDLGAGVAVDADGRILVTGRTPQNSTSTLERMILMRLR
jgi:uncharacterized delta-60 repeat protein